VSRQSEFLNFATGSFRTEFLIDLEPCDKPEDPAMIFEQGEHRPVLLRIFLDGIQINCHFSSPGEIELDLDPEEVGTQEDFVSSRVSLQSGGLPTLQSVGPGAAADHASDGRCPG
jgi:hypothetical protein